MENKWHFFLLILLTLSCQKEDESGCNDDAKTVRIITRAPASISFFENQYFIIEQNTIDTRLLPCTLPVAFQKEKLAVTISGEVKDYPNGEKVQICCTERIILRLIQER